MIFDEISKTYIEDPKGEKIHIEVGDSKAAEAFYPRVKLKAWDNECNFSIGLAPNGNETPTIEEIDGLIKWKTSKVEAHFYAKEPDVINLDGAYEFEVVLNERPTSNIINLTTNIPKELAFHYQPALTQEEIAEGCERPDNVVGSYAVYHASKAHNEYKTGKAFHIYRPEAIDSAGSKTWCELNIDIEAQSATITVPQEYLDGAVYPVFVDPTFGYTTTGASVVNLGKYGPYYSRFQLPENAIVQSITAFVKKMDIPENVKLEYALLDDDKNYLDISSEGLITSSSYSWITLEMSDSGISPDYYWLAARTDNAGYDNTVNKDGWLYDSIDGNDACRDYTAWGDGWPNPVSAESTYTNRKFSIYATYDLPANIYAGIVTGRAFKGLKNFFH